MYQALSASLRVAVYCGLPSESVAESTLVETSYMRSGLSGETSLPLS